jgi:pimeloyl-ACP methyl ester carboxylesterase
MVDMGRLVAGPLAPLVVADRYDTFAALKRVSCPVVLFHGTNDEVIPYEMGRRLAAAHPSSRLVTLEGATHNDMPGLERLLASGAHEALERPSSQHKTQN